MNEKSKAILALSTEVIGCLFLFLLILVLLNYLNILSLSTIYPKQFGFLPTISSLKSSNTNSKGSISKSATSSNQQFAIGEIKQATANSISIISPSNKDKLIEYTVDKNTTFEQTAAFDIPATSSATFEKFTQIMITAKNLVIKIFYVTEGSTKFAGKVLFLN